MKHVQYTKCRSGGYNCIPQNPLWYRIAASGGRFAASLIGLAMCGSTSGQVILDPAGAPRPSGDDIPIGTRGPFGTYQYDDGELDSALGGTIGELCWIQVFETQSGYATLRSISTAWGPGAVNGAAGRIFVWADPTNDGVPNDAELLHQQNVVVTSRCSGYGVQCPPIEYLLTTPVEVSGKFFVGASTQMNGNYVAPIDRDSQSFVNSQWYDYDPGTFNPMGLSNAISDPNTVDTWMLRAQGVTSGFTYQGRLKQDGTAVDGLADLEFELFDSLTGGTQLGQTVLLTNVEVDEGLFTVQLPFSAAEFDREARYLQIRAAFPAGGSLAALSPRQSISPTPQAFHAFTVEWNGIRNIPATLRSSLDASDGVPQAVVSVDGEGGVGIFGPMRLLPVGTLLHSGANAAGIPGADGFRLYTGSFPDGGRSYVFDKTAITPTPDGGGFAFVSTGNNNVPRPLMGIRGNGTVGVGLLTPTAKLHVGGVAGTDGIRFPDDTLQTTAFSLAGNGVASSAARSDHTHSSLAASDGSPAQAVAVNADGDVGIGTLAPDAPLHVATVTDVSLGGGGAVIIGSPTATNISIDDNEIMARDNAGIARLSLQNEGGQVVIGSGGGIDVAAPHRLIAVDTQPGLLSLPLRLDNASSTTGSSTGIGFRVTGTNQPKGALAYERTTSTFGRGKFHFLQNTVADDSLPALTDSVMTITNGGFVGVGTTDPVAKLHLNGDSFWIGGTDSGSLNSAAGAGIRMLNTATESVIYAYDFSVGANRNLTLQNSGGGTGVGNVGIGRSPATNRLEVEGTASKTASGSWLANSDRRIKRDVRSVTDALETLDRVRLVSFQYTDEYKSVHPSVGDREYLNVIAQEFADVFPDWVQASGEKLSDGSEVLQVDTHPLLIYSAAAVQELHQKVRERDERIADLEARLARIEALLAADAGDLSRTHATGKVRGQ